MNNPFQWCCSLLWNGCPTKFNHQVPSPAKTSTGETVVDALGWVAGAVADAADQDGQMVATRALQVGLGLLGQHLKNDGDPGPKTRAATRQKVADVGPKTTQAFADSVNAFGADGVTKAFADEMGFGFG